MLGPEKLPRVVSELGRWMGRARAMARQFREQLEEEVQLEQARKAQAERAAAPPPPPAFGMIQGQKKQQKSPTATFLGTGDIANISNPSSGVFSGGKTLLGT